MQLVNNVDENNNRNTEFIILVLQEKSLNFNQNLSLVNFVSEKEIAKFFGNYSSNRKSHKMASKTSNRNYIENNLRLGYGEDEKNNLWVI